MCCTGDGILDARSPEGDFFGSHALPALLMGLNDEPPSEICGAVITSVARFCGSRGCTDNMTLGVVKVI